MDEYVHALCEQIRISSNLTAVGIGVLIDQQDPTVAVAGRRREKSDVAVEKHDRWHIGSITKSITALLIATQVNSGNYDFDTPIGTLLNHIDIHPSRSEITVKQLLTHTAKLQSNFSLITRLRSPKSAESSVAYRARLISEVLKTPCGAKKFSDMHYSNVGYAIAGHIAESVAKTSFEHVVTREIFAKCNLVSAGFGAPKGKTFEQEPMGHSSLLGFRRPADPFGAGFTDNGIELSAAGRVHMSLNDLLQYGNIHLYNDRNRLLNISTKTWNELHTPILENYACGWVVEDHEDWSGRLLWHNGSNTLWYALLMLVPSKDMVIAFATNNGSVRKAEQAFFSAARDIVKKF